MRTTALAGNVVLLAFAVFMLAIDGMPSRAGHAIFTILVVGVPLVTVLAMLARTGPAVRGLVSGGNLVLMGFAGWVLASQLPHAVDPVVAPFALLAVAMPILSTTVLLRH